MLVFKKAGFEQRFEMYYGTNKLLFQSSKPLFIYTESIKLLFYFINPTLKRGVE